MAQYFAGWCATKEFQIMEILFSRLNVETIKIIGFAIQIPYFFIVMEKLDEKLFD